MPTALKMGQDVLTTHQLSHCTKSRAVFDNQVDLFHSIQTRNLKDELLTFPLTARDKYLSASGVLVCGDCRSPKAAVIRTLFGLQIPTWEDLNLSIPVQINLQPCRSPETEGEIQITIKPSFKRPEEEKKKLLDFKYFAEKVNVEEINRAFDEVSSLIMNKDGESMGIYLDILQIQYTSKMVPCVNIFDCPPLDSCMDFSTAEECLERQNFTRSLLEDGSTTILAIAAANSTPRLQKVHLLAKEVDPKGTRTLGLVTRLEERCIGAESEAPWRQLVENKDSSFPFTWMIVGDDEIGLSASTASGAEGLTKKLQKNSSWSFLSESQTGIANLRSSLFEKFRDHVVGLNEPILDFIDHMQAPCDDLWPKLEVEGNDAGALKRAQRKYLLQKSLELSRLIQSAVDGNYSKHDFEDCSTLDPRLKSAVLRELKQFVVQMEVMGKAHIIVKKGEDWDKKDNKISFEQCVQNVCNTADVFGLQVVDELFKEECSPWKGIALNSAVAINRIVFNFAIKATIQVFGEKTASLVNDKIILPRLTRLRDTVISRVSELVKNYTEGSALTFTSALENDVRRRRAETHQETVREIFKRFGLDSQNCSKATIPKGFFDAIVNDTMPDKTLFAAEMAVHTTEAFYSIALARFIDEFCVSIMNRLLLNDIQMILTPEEVCDMSDEHLDLLFKKEPDANQETCEDWSRLYRMFRGEVESLCATFHDWVVEMNKDVGSKKEGK